MTAGLIGAAGFLLRSHCSRCSSCDCGGCAARFQQQGTQMQFGNKGGGVSPFGGICEADQGLAQEDLGLGKLQLHCDQSLRGLRVWSGYYLVVWRPLRCWCVSWLTLAE